MSYPASESVGVVRSSWRRLPWMIVVGGVFVVAGLALIVFAVSMRDDSPLFLLGGVLLGAGVIRLTTALAAEARRRAHPHDPDDPRWSDGVAPMQLAGRTCVECGRRIIIGADGLSCDQCAAPAHVECRESHHAHVHGPEPRFT